MAHACVALAVGLLAVGLGLFISKNGRYFDQLDDSQLIVSTTAGEIRGIQSRSRDGQVFYEWLGIPYAKAPVGPLRFASPVPAEKWAGIRPADAYGADCAQIDLFLETTTGSEDCLFVNVHVPEKVRKRGILVPVVFFIHGGYFVSGTSRLFRPDYFMDEDVVFMTIQYRVGALGFLSTGDGRVRGNMGLRDQSLALKWAHENAAKFGGDPKRLTIAGVSAGASCVHYQMLSPLNKGLISRAISQSGTAISSWALMDDPWGQAQKFAAALKCPTSNSLEMVNCLRALKVTDLLEAHRPFLNVVHDKSDVFVPTVETILDEETFLPAHPLDLVRAGNFSRVPWLVGYNKDEGLIVTRHFYTNESYREFVQNNWPEFSRTQLLLSPKEMISADKIRDFYFSDFSRIDGMSAFPALTQLLTDRWFSVETGQAAKFHAQYAPTYFYRYDKPGPSFFNMLISLPRRLPVLLELFVYTVQKWVGKNVLGNHREKSYGVCHGDELVMEFYMPNIFWVGQYHPDFQFSKQFVRFIRNFVHGSTLEFAGVRFDSLEAKGPLGFFELTEKPRWQLAPDLERRIKFWELVSV